MNLNNKLKQRYETTDHTPNLELFRICKSKSSIRLFKKDSVNKNQTIIDKFLENKIDFIPINKKNSRCSDK